MPVPEKCRLCGSGPADQDVITSHVYGGTAGQGYYQCQCCDVIYQYPPIDEEEEARFYRSEFEKFMADRSGTKEWHHPSEHVSSNAQQVRRRMQYLAPLLAKENLDVCEVGCSSGFMLYPLRELGHRIVGVEPSGIFDEFLRDKGIIVYSSLDCIPPELKFDLLMHYFVLEHIKDPWAFLSRCMELIRKGGKMVFEVPNAAEPLRTIYDIPEFERFYWSYPHHWYFSETSLAFLLENLGVPFEIRGDQRYDLSNHMSWAMTGRPGGMRRFTEKLGKELEDIYREKLIQSGFCDTLVGVVTNDE